MEGGNNTVVNCLPTIGSAANQVLSNILKLQDNQCISAYLFSLGLDDQDPAQWGDDELLVVPEADCLSDSEEEEGEEEEEELEQQRGAGGGAAAELVVPEIAYPSDSEEEEGEEEE